MSLLTHRFTEKRKFSALLTLIVGVAIPLNANATGYITPGSPQAKGGFAENVPPGGLAPVTYFEKNRSYACTIIGSSITSQLKVEVSTAPGSSSVSSTARNCGAITPKVVTSGGDATAGAGSDGASDNRVCFIADESGVYNLTLDTDLAVSEPAIFSCSETTLYGGYNTNANPFNFLEVINTTNTAIEFQVRAANFDGTVVINNATYTVAPNRRVDVNVHVAAGTNKFGSIRVMHNGPYGALQANVSQYNGTDTSLNLTTSNALRPRDQNL